MAPDRPDVLTNPIGVQSDQVLELGDDGLNCIKNLVEAVGYRAFSIGVGVEDSMFKCYAEHRLSVHFHFGLLSSSGEIDFGDYCAVFQGAIKDMDCAGSLAGGNSPKRTPMSRGLRHGDKLVLISGVQFLKEPERVSLRMRSLIRLAEANVFDCAWMDAAYSAYTSFVEPIFALKDGELCASVSQPATSEPPSEIIESRARIMDAISEDKTPSYLRDRFGIADLKEILSLFRVELSDNSVGVAVEKTPQFRVKNFTMFFSPRDFMPALREW